ncbi:hypothetical protein Tco_0906704 [Tanacetum coccineum]|uniref:Uncharacterized protein n=1 Tax=Tanacetum coccineum TaxID=301880 RepID=A0ABQ5CNE1_9ASTR
MRINLHKSKIMGIAVDNSLVTQAANSIGCLTLSLPFQYLGVNIGSHMSRIKSWDIVLTPIYYMSMYKAPMYVINKLEAIRSHFFNGGDPNIRKMTFVKWENVLASKDKGGNSGSMEKLGYHIKPKGVNQIGLICFALSYFVKQGIDLLDTLRKRLFALELDKKISMAGKMAQPSLITSFRRNPRSGTEASHRLNVDISFGRHLSPNILKEGVLPFRRRRVFCLLG